jgi:hypothetical protein
VKTITATVSLAAMILVVAAATVVHAHDVFYPGTVLSVGTDTLRVNTIDAKTNKEENLAFTVTKDTIVKRGDTTVAFADAKIIAGERIVVVVDHDAATKNVATVLRLAAR